MRLLLSSLLHITATSLIAQDLEASLTDFDSTTIVLDEIKVETDLFGQSAREFAGSVSSIKPEQIDRADGLYLNSLINSIPGVYMHSGALNTNRITIRGIGSRSPFGTNKIKAYLDEIPLSSGEGETTLEDIDFATLGGIEVYRGPSSTLYGAGLGGAIHMLTDSPKKSELSTGFSVGSFGLSKFQLQGQIANSTESLSLYYQDILSEGYRDNNKYDRKSVTLIGKKLWGDKTTTTAYLNYTLLDAFIPSSLELDDYNNNPESAAFIWQEARGKENTKKYRLGFSIKNNDFQNTELSLALFSSFGESDEIRPSFLGNTGVQYHNIGLRTYAKKSMLEDQLSVALGSEILTEQFTYQEFEQIDRANGAMTLDFDQERKYANIFLVSNYQPSEQWLISLGSNLNYSSYDLDDAAISGQNQSGKRTFPAVFSPKLSVSRFLGEYWALYGMASHGFSLPTFEETLFPGGLVNNRLRAEKGWNYEVGIKGQTDDRKLQTEISLFVMKIDDLIVGRNVNDTNVGINAGSATYRGIEISGKHLVLSTEALNLSQSLSLTLMDNVFNDFVDGSDDFSDNEITGVPSHTLDYQLTARHQTGIYGNINWQGVGEMPILDNNSLYSDAYNVLNLKLGYQRQIGQFGVDISGGINNLWDEKYASMIQINSFRERYFYPGLPTNYYAGLKLNYLF